jgi:SOS-response transcriptional repressor LexA
MKKEDYNGLSPLLRHALESFEHGLDHFLDGTETGRKFALLHIDQAIELIIKEKLVRMGKSISKGDGTTITIHEALNSLCKEISVLERPRLESLHDLRNNIQHTGLTVDAYTTDFYVIEAYKFVKKFLKDELNIDFAQYITVEILHKDAAVVLEPPENESKLVTKIFSGEDIVSIPIRGTEESLEIDRALLGTNINNIFGYYVLTNDMEADSLISKDDILIIQEKSKIKNGQLVLIKVQNRTLLQYIYYNGNQIRLQPPNPVLNSEVYPSSSVNIIGQVKMVIRRVKST